MDYVRASGMQEFCRLARWLSGNTFGAWSPVNCKPAESEKGL